MKHTVTPKFETKDGTTVVMDPVTYEVVLTQGDIKTVDVETYTCNQSRPVYRTYDDTRTYVRCTERRILCEMMDLDIVRRAVWLVLS